MPWPIHIARRHFPLWLVSEGWQYFAFVRSPVGSERLPRGRKTKRNQPWNGRNSSAGFRSRKGARGNGADIKSAGRGRQKKNPRTPPCAGRASESPLSVPGGHLRSTAG